MGKGWVRCLFCGNDFLKDRRHINENLRLGHNFYCSINCQSFAKNNQLNLICTNPLCSKRFLRRRKNIGLHNYCSQTCAAIVNNSLKNRSLGLVSKKHMSRLTDEERQVIRVAASSLGGRNRWKDYQSKYTGECIILAIQSFVHQNGRLPVKRELQRFDKPARKFFGTWNKAIETAGFKPNPVMFANHQIASDGHICDSIAEKVIDDYLFEKGIEHQRNYPYPEGGYTCDFKIGELFIEYFGLAGEHKRYDQLREIKQRIAKKYKIRLIGIYPKDLYSKDASNFKKVFD